MKRLFLLLSIFAIVGIVASLTHSRAQQTTTDELSTVLLPVPPNVIGTSVRGVSTDGKRIVFESINDYNGRNVDSNTEIWAYDVDTRSIIMITDTADIKDPADATKTLFRINSVSPVLSGDGTKIAFVSNADLGGTTNEDRNYEVYLADLPRGATKATITRLTDTGKDSDNEVVKEIFSNYGLSISDDGALVAFTSTRRTFKAITGGAPQFSAAKEGPNNSDPDGNGELFIYDTKNKRYTQVTISRDVDATDNFTVKGFNANPVFSGDGRKLIFLSGFNYAGTNANKNADFNGEIFSYRVGDPANTFTQITQTDATADAPVVPLGNPVNVLAAFTRPLSTDGSKLVFESSANFAGQNSDKTREIFLADLSGATPTFKQITNQTTVDITKNDFSFFPSVNGAGTFITFSSVLNLTPVSSGSSVTTDNADGSREVFRYDIAGAKFRQLTFTGLSGFVLDQRDNTTSSFADNSGNLVTFSYDANLIGPNGSPIRDLFQTRVLTVASKTSAEVKLANAASFDNTQVARSSIVAAFGSQLANTTVGAPTNNLPFDLAGVTVNVAGIAARLIFVSPQQINFVMPQIVASGDAVEFTVNNNGVQSTGKVKLTDFAPGVFSTTGDGKGKSAVQCGAVSADGLNFLASAPPCAIGTSLDANVLIIYGTGWRNTSSVQVKIGDQTLIPSFSGAQPEFLGLDQINVNLPVALADKLDQEIVVSIAATTAVDSNKTTVSFGGVTAAITTIANAASFEVTEVARGSLAVAQGESLANDTATDNSFPFELKGVKVTVAGKPARVNYVSPTQVNFVLPNDVSPATLVQVAINNNGKLIVGRVKVLDGSPGVFTTTGDGNGRALARCGRVNTDGSITYSDPPCAVGTEAAPNQIRIIGTGWRNATSVVLKIGDTELTTTFVGGQPDGSGGSAFGTDIIDAKLAPALAGKTDVDVIVTTKTAAGDKSSKTGIKVSFSN